MYNLLTHIWIKVSIIASWNRILIHLLKSQFIIVYVFIYVFFCAKVVIMNGVHTDNQWIKFIRLSTYESSNSEYVLSPPPFFFLKTTSKSLFVSFYYNWSAWLLLNYFWMAKERKEQIVKKSYAFQYMYNFLENSSSCQPLQIYYRTIYHSFHKTFYMGISLDTVHHTHAVHQASFITSTG